MLCTEYPRVRGTIEHGYEELIRQAHAHGLKIFGGTLTTFKGSFYWSTAAETTREAVNNWIRTSHAFDGVIDFAKATQDRYDPLYLDPAYNSGDNLHPSDAGCEPMANTIDLALLTWCLIGRTRRKPRLLRLGSVRARGRSGPNVGAGRGQRGR
jgi:GDSL-like Lipase/Acylhydrolase family